MHNTLPLYAIQCIALVIPYCSLSIWLDLCCRAML